MKFTEAFPMLLEGRRIRRATWAGNPRFVRLVDPYREPGVDGPTEVYFVSKEDTVLTFKSGSSTLDQFESEKEAKDALTAARKDLREQWARYRRTEKEWEDAEETKREHMKREALPALAEDYYKAGVEVASRPASKVGRMNVPYFVAAGRDGSNFPFSFSTPDLLAQDWTEA